MTSLIYFPYATNSGPRLLLTRSQVLTWCSHHQAKYSEHYDDSDYVVILTDKRMLTMFMLEWQGEEFYIHTPNFWPKNFLV
jgi:hypothetical protein